MKGRYILLWAIALCLAITSFVYTATYVREAVFNPFEAIGYEYKGPFRVINKLEYCDIVDVGCIITAEYVFHDEDLSIEGCSGTYSLSNFEKIYPVSKLRITAHGFMLLVLYMSGIWYLFDMLFNSDNAFGKFLDKIFSV